MICSRAPQWFVRLGLASRRPDPVVVLAGRFFHCTFSLLWVWPEPLLHLCAVDLLRCLHVERQQFALAQRSPSASSPDQPNASTRSPAESRTFLVSAASRRPVLPNQSRHRCSRPPLQLWAPAYALSELRIYLTSFVSDQSLCSSHQWHMVSYPGCARALSCISGPELIGTRAIRLSRQPEDEFATVSFKKTLLHPVPHNTRPLRSVRTTCWYTTLAGSQCHDNS